MKRIIKNIAVLGITIFMMVWGYALLKCEILTYLHWQEFYGLDKLNAPVIKSETVKVLEYSETKAKVYYVDDRGGLILEFIKKDEQWISIRSKYVWSQGGTADGLMWPYGR